jgi:hypothetical protein
MLKNTLNASHKQYAINGYLESLSMFGAGYDMRIYEAKNGNRGYTRLGYTYELPPGCNQE